MRAAGSGDAAAFGELIARHRSSALRVATVVLGSATGADDVVQDADVRAWRARASIDPARGFRSWYLRVVANAARNGRRARGRRAALELRDARSSGADTAPDPADRVVTAAERRAVIAAVNRLGRDDRLVIALRHFEQLGEGEMAEVLGCPPGTVKSRLSRAMARLREQLEHLQREEAR
ncbi:MAG: RNA polymerase sigma factor [Acidimicrobiia bacterium]